MSPVAQSYLGIPGYVIFWVLFAIAFGLFAQRAFLLVRLLRLGRPENRFDHLLSRFTRAIVVTVSQWCNLKSVKRGDVSGIGHSFMFWGFCLFLLSYVIFIGFGYGFGLYPHLTDNAFEQVFYSILDIAAVLVMASLVWAAIRRYIIKPQRLQGHPSAEAAVILALVFSLMILHIFSDAFYMAGTDNTASWPPISSALAGLFSGSGISQDALLKIYKGLWWLHYLVVLSFLVFIPRSKHLHILASSINVAFKSSAPKGALKTIDIKKKEELGVAKIQDFTWKQLLDGYACAHCGRCHAICPAQVSGKPLSPRELILDMKDHLLEVGPGLLRARGAEVKTAAPSAAAPKTEAGEGDSLESPKPVPAESDKALVGDVISEDAIWSCTTCRACVEVCPSYNEQMYRIIDLRRHLTMVDTVETGRDTLKNLRMRGHPWRGTMYARTDWTEGLDIKIVGEDNNIDVLLWVGCTEALEDRSIKVAQALARILKAAGINFGILGEEEMCCGDPARRLGAEHLFQMSVMNNIQLFQSYNIKKIVTACPHCFNTLKNEYPQFGGQFEVIHHSQFIAGLIKEKRLNIKAAAETTAAYHDSCYLGRYNDIYLPPREVLNSIPGIKLAEMDNNKKYGFCCGGGGGRMFLEEKIGTRISEMRLDQISATKAQIVATACPYCLQMFEDAAKAKSVEDTLKVKDIAELVADSLEVNKTEP
jgi:Fe-S oxidoreductase